MPGSLRSFAVPTTGLFEFSGRLTAARVPAGCVWLGAVVHEIDPTSQLALPICVDQSGPTTHVAAKPNSTRGSP